MSALMTLATAGVAGWLYARRCRRSTGQHGAGASAARHATQLRSGLWPTLAGLLGITTRAHQDAARWDAGAEGERRTAALLDQLPKGWWVGHDRALPNGRANIDHLVITPSGVVIVPDSKLWSARWRVRPVNGRLFHGNLDVTARIDAVRYETWAVSEALGVPVVPVIVMHGAPVDGGALLLDEVRIVPAERLLAVLLTFGRVAGFATQARLVARAEHALPPYTQAYG